MKKIKFLSLMLAVLLMVGCSASPEKVTKNFLNNIKQKKWDEANKLGTEKTRKFVEQISGFSNALDLSKFKFEITETVIDNDGNKAVCTYTFEDGKDKKEQKLNLVKVDGAWKVDTEK